MSFCGFGVAVAARSANVFDTFVANAAEQEAACVPGLYNQHSPQNAPWPRPTSFVPFTACEPEPDGMMPCADPVITGNLELDSEDLSPEGLAFRIRRVRAYMGNGGATESALRSQLSLSIALDNNLY